MSTRVARRARSGGSRRCHFALDEAVVEMTPEAGTGPDRDLRFAIDDALVNLPPNYRAAIVLCYLEGLTHEEAAERLRCPVGTVRSRLARGRALLRDRLERSGLAPSGTREGPSKPSEQDSFQAVVFS